MRSETRSRMLAIWLFLLVITGCEFQSPIPGDAPPPSAAVRQTTQAPKTDPSHSTETQDGASELAVQFDSAAALTGIVRIDFLNGGPLGYGVVVDRSSTGFDVITADHVLGEKQSVIVQSWTTIDGRNQLRPHTNISVMLRDPLKDLAWVRVKADDSQVRPLPLGSVTTPDKQGWRATCYRDDSGKPEFVSMNVTCRGLAKRSEDDQPVSYWQLSDKVAPGMSGGPLLTEEGKWVGIASGNSQGRAYYIDELEVRAFLRQAGLK